MKYVHLNQISAIRVPKTTNTNMLTLIQIGVVPIMEQDITWTSGDLYDWPCPANRVWGDVKKTYQWETTTCPSTTPSTVDPTAPVKHQSHNSWSSWAIWQVCRIL